MISTPALYPAIFSRTMYDPQATSASSCSLKQKIQHIAHLIFNCFKLVLQKHTRAENLARAFSWLSVENLRHLSDKNMGEVVPLVTDATALSKAIHACYVSEKAQASLPTVIKSPFQRLLSFLSVNQLMMIQTSDEALQAILGQKIIEHRSRALASPQTFEELTLDNFQGLTHEALQLRVFSIVPQEVYQKLLACYQQASKDRLDVFVQLLKALDFETLDGVLSIPKQEPLDHFFAIQALIEQEALSRLEGEKRLPCRLKRNLGEDWKFRTDHLPVGGTIQLNGQPPVYFALWNILKRDYLSFIESNDQGLKGSLITTENEVGEEGLTKREVAIVQDILEMLSPTASHPRALIALQEVHLDVYKALKERLPPHMKIVPELYNGEDIFIYDARVFDYQKESVDPYSRDIHRSAAVRSVVLKHRASGLVCHFVQSHVPGGPTNSVPARNELAEKTLAQYKPDALTILLGDMNHESAYFQAYFEKFARKMGMAEQPFQALNSSYPTHVNTRNESSYIDNIFVALPESELSPVITSDNPCDFNLSVEAMVQLMQGARS